jgi:type I restriction enzyme S subunit
MKRWPLKPLGEFVEEIAERLGEKPATIYSVTNERGFVRSLDLFDKQVFSANTSNYKVTRFRDLAYNPSRINVGSVAMCEDRDGGAVSPMYIVVRCKEGVLPRYLLHFLKSEAGLHQIRHRCEGAVRFQLKFRDLCAIPIVTPSLAEQERIVKLLDEADELRKVRAKADHRTADLIPAHFYEMFGDPVTNSKRWLFAPVSDLLTEPLRNGVSPAKDGTYQAKVFTLSAISGEVFDPSAWKDALFARPPESNCLVSDNLFLICRGNGNRLLVGRAKFPRNVEHEIIFPDTMIAAVPNLDKLSAVYLEEAWNLPTTRIQILSGARTTNGTYKINQTVVEQLRLPLPPLSLQIEFAARVAEIRAMEAEQAVSRCRLDDLFQSMLHRAFNGELSTQIDSGDVSVVVKSEHEEQNAGMAKHSKGIMFRRAAFDCYVITNLEGDKNLGRTKIEKISHLAEYHCGIDLERNPVRDAAGPNDYPSRIKVESLAKKLKWYRAIPQAGNSKVDYLPGPNISKSRHTAENFLGERKPAVDALILLMRPLDTAACEIVATLYAACNDFLLAGKTPKDDELITEVRHNWHPDKLRIPVDEWQKGLIWMREHQLTARGVGRPTIRNKSV